MERCREEFAVRLMCRCLKVSASGYYAWRHRPLSRRAQENHRILNRIRELHAGSDGVMGAPRIWEELRYVGERCSKKRVARLMRVNGLAGIPQRRRRRSKASSQRPDGIDNRLQRDFRAEAVNEKWVTDITYVHTGEHWLYVCAVIDLCSGVVVGWSMNCRQGSELVIRALSMAVWQRQGSSAVIVHSDRGCQYTSEAYQRYLKSHGLIGSMSAAGSCADNAAAESFFGLLKRERVYRRSYRTRDEARVDIFDYIERFHNARKRRRMQWLAQRTQALTQPSVISG
jgi:putative transposase